MTTRGNCHFFPGATMKLKFSLFATALGLATVAVFPAAAQQGVTDT
jgi:hypothetical protein